MNTPICNTLALAAMTGATLTDIAMKTVSGFSTDTRTLKCGDLYIALRGPRHDGNNHLQAAIEAGASAVMSDRKEIFTGTVPLLHVEDTRAALARLASAWRRQFAAKGIAVCGSNGKTTVKDMIASILAVHYGQDGYMATHANENNQIGVARSLLGLRNQHQAFVVELGTNHPGEIAQLAPMSGPDVALINNAQREHQEFFTNTDTVALENAAVLMAMGVNGIGVLPADSPYLFWWKAVLGQRQILTFGQAKDADVRILSWEPSDQGGSLVLKGKIAIPSINLRVAGHHNALNAAAAASCAYALGIPPVDITLGLESYSGTAGRLVFRQRRDGLTIIDDTYNANPDSVRAAIDVLASQPGRRCLILGDMGECGDQSARFHAEAGAYARARGIECLMCLGRESQNAAAAFGAEASCFNDVGTLLQVLAATFDATSILVKGSRFMQMERVVQALLAQIDAKSSGSDFEL